MTGHDSVRASLTSIVFLTGVALSTASSANDTTARVGVGGLVFTKTQAVAMEVEHLVISPSRIRVAYIFRNTTHQDVRTVVAFPTPAYPGCLSEAQTEQNQRPVEGLATQVDGKPVTTTLVRSAVVGSVDVTQKLRAAGLPETWIFPPMRLPYCLNLPEEDELSPAQRRRLKAASLPKGEIRTTDTYHWTQTFPAGGQVKVTHEYAPFPGGIYGFASPGSTDEFRWVPISSLQDDRIDRACVDESARAIIVARVKSLLNAGASDVQVTLRDVEYILGTAKNWKGAIGSFALDLVKEDPEEVVSLCFPGRAKRLDATTLRFEHRNFVPPDRIHVNFYSITASKR